RAVLGGLFECLVQRPHRLRRGVPAAREVQRHSVDVDEDLEVLDVGARRGTPRSVGAGRPEIEAVRVVAAEQQPRRYETIVAHLAKIGDAFFHEEFDLRVLGDDTDTVFARVLDLRYRAGEVALGDEDPLVRRDRPDPGEQPLAVLQARGRVDARVL